MVIIITNDTNITEYSFIYDLLVLTQASLCGP
jgi:hypothetical protein